MPLKRFPTNSGYLYYGSLPGVAELKLIRKNKIDVIWNLAKEFGDMASYEKQFAPTVITGNITDYGVPDNPGAFLFQVKHVAALLKAGKKVFVHCHGGRGRTGMILAALKIAVDGSDATSSLHMVNEVVGGPDTDEQESFIEFYAPYLAGKVGKLPKFEYAKSKSIDWNDYPEIDWNNYPGKGKQQKPSSIPEKSCYFCKSEDIVAAHNLPNQSKKMYLCKVCNALWSNATDEEKARWSK